MKSKPIKTVDVFSGVGGLSLGAARAGLDVVLSIENDPHAVKAHRVNFPNANHAGVDVRTLDGEELRAQAKVKADEPLGIIGGPPCQGFSSMGHRQADDPRNQLFSKFFELVRDAKPVFFLAENVPGIMRPSSDALREAGLDIVRNDYELLPPVCVKANEFGVATTRTRYLFVGYRTDWLDPLCEEDIQGVEDRTTVGEALKGLPKVQPSWLEEKQGWRGVKYGDMESRFWQRVQGHRPEGVGDEASVKKLIEKNIVSGCLGTAHTKAVLKRFSEVTPGTSDKVSKSPRLKSDGYCPTLRAGTGPERGSYQAVRPIHPTAHRVITPREAARLQGFPDWFQFSPTKWHSFRQIGNSVCPPLAEIVFRHILEKRKK